MKKILLIHTGGTFGMMPVEPSRALAPADIRHLILTHLPEIERIARVDFEVPFNLDSANIQISHWQHLGLLIKTHYDEYDGFVIIHGTDTMVYTASALSFMLQGLGKPVILTGSQRPLAEIRSDARSNLIDSIELATRPIPEVAIYFGTNLLRGNRAIKISSSSYQAFATPNFAPLAKVGLDITLSEHVRPPGKSFNFSDQMDSAVYCFRFFPGLTPGSLLPLQNPLIKGVVVEALGVGNVAILENSLIPWIREMTKSGRIIVISSQSPFGAVNLHLYQSGEKVMKAGGLSAGDMTIPTAIVKLMFLLGHYPGEPDQIKKNFITSLAGELTEI